MKKVLFACGNGVATSTMVRSKVEDYLADKGIFNQGSSVQGAGSLCNC